LQIDINNLKIGKFTKNNMNFLRQTGYINFIKNANNKNLIN